MTAVGPPPCATRTLPCNIPTPDVSRIAKVRQDGGLRRRLPQLGPCPFPPPSVLIPKFLELRNQRGTLENQSLSGLLAPEVRERTSGGRTLGDHRTGAPGEDCCARSSTGPPATLGAPGRRRTAGRAGCLPNRP